ncbi:hypothetical protein SODALDRAFT_322869 [Sodiomyces alkalinus F11]|uniref:Uncharacterized protein n=1 Tax=Sodiomyces alkalinus (strain CBS 110278 / VKM F-3762 / F11) TaxID=1314773 RepID=A0A3N2PY93_SODAK|nr:hypothetical protein SODALDRAFT_322869 [Sodiomyces alkalinus F11]ROT39467.1 hypothetical protein SODALDRAFT_322869 [Sodiomyces alkalinus F11]
MALEPKPRTDPIRRAEATPDHVLTPQGRRVGRELQKTSNLPSTMPSPFHDPPCGSREKEKAWIGVAKRGFRSPWKLWNEYCKRFNTITIPLLDEDAYFADAISAARHARDCDHLEELLAKKFEERRRELELLVS